MNRNHEIHAGEQAIRNRNHEIHAGEQAIRTGTMQFRLFGEQVKET